ncbi:hypothetical protein V500_00257 [Pseudogymnoascus sp. VKM F-4518 (FW-2643)]|nr:hypothetical protein V500_00257 [Pseudogymnoascus sp. VKM F-4518 (FW-2643)]
MVKLTIAIAAFVAMLPIVAGDCNRGLLYCGFTLMDKKGYSEHELAYFTGRYICSAHDLAVLRRSLFRCEPKPGHIVTGEPVYLGFCNNECHDGGRGKSDHCT